MNHYNDCFIFFLISAVFIKEGLDNAFNVQNEPDINSLLFKQDCLNKVIINKKKNQIIETDYSINEFDIKEDPLQDDVVSIS